MDNEPNNQPTVNREPPNPTQPQSEKPINQAPSSEPQVNVSPSTEPVTSNPVIPPASPKFSSVRKRFALILGLSVAIAIVLFGAAAALYLGYVVPNRPSNVLKTAIENTLAERDVSFNSNLNITTSGSSKMSYKLIANGAANLNSKAVDVNLSLTVDGVNIPVEVRMINQNVYFKAGDLSQLASLIGAYSPQAASITKSLASSISNKWIVVDSTLVKQIPGASCTLDSNWGLTKSDINYLVNQYNKNKFVTITSTSSDTVNGQPAEKFNLNINNNSAASFSSAFQHLSLVQSIEKCTNGKPLATIKGDGRTVPITVWVNKSSKLISKISFNSSPTSKTIGSFTTTLTYGNVNISTPSGAIPAAQFILQIERSLTLSSGTASLL